MIDQDPEIEYRTYWALFVLALKIILGVLAALAILSLIGEQLLYLPLQGNS